MSAKKRIIGLSKGQYRVIRKGKKPTPVFIIWFKSASPTDVPENLVGWRSLDKSTSGEYRTREAAERAIRRAVRPGNLSVYTQANFEVRELGE